MLLSYDLEGECDAAGENTGIQKCAPAAVHSLPGGCFRKYSSDRCQQESNGAAQAVEPYRIQLQTEGILMGLVCLQAIRKSESSKKEAINAPQYNI